ncbi:MAG: hypothetical protein ACFHX7_16525 [Pseudomonadota bacterium]
MFRNLGYGLLLMFFVLPSVQADAIGETIGRGFANPALADARLRINMNDDQKSQFDATIARYRKDLDAMVRKVIRTAGTRYEQELRRKNGILVKKMDKQMAGLLRADQLPLYESYRDLLNESISLKCRNLRC